MLNIKNITKVYNRNKKNEITALRNIDFNIERNGLVLINGKSGSGKTTLLNCISGFDTYDIGEIIYPQNCKKVSYIFQEFYLLDNLTVYDNLKLCLNIYNILDYDNIDNVLYKLDIFDFKFHYPNQLSGGQKQRVAIARAILINNPIILADEPTGNLDSENSMSIAELLNEVAKDHIVIVVSHNNDLFEKFAYRIITMENGMIINDTINQNEQYISKLNINDFQAQRVSHLSNNSALTLAFKWIKSKSSRFVLALLSLFFGILLILVSMNISFNNTYKTNYNYFTEFKINNVDYFKKNNENEGSIIYESIDSKLINQYMEEYDAFKVMKSRHQFNSIDSLMNNLNINKIYITEHYDNEKINDNNVFISDYLAEELYSGDFSNKKIIIENVEFQIQDTYKTNYKNIGSQYYEKYINEHCRAIYLNDKTYNKLNDHYESEVRLDFEYNGEWKFEKFKIYDNEKLDLLIGEYSIKTNEIVISESLANKLYLEVNDEIINKHITLSFENITIKKDFNFKIIGVSKYNTYISKNVYLDLYHNFNINKFNFNSIEGISVYNISPRIIEKLEESCLYHDTFISQSFYNSRYSMKMINKIFLFTGTIVFIMGTIILINYINNSINCRKKDIGVLLSLYLPNRNISKIFFFESIIVLLSSFIFSSLALYPIIGVINKLLIRENIIIYNFINYSFIVNIYIMIILIFVGIIYNIYCFQKLKKHTIIDLLYLR